MSSFTTTPRSTRSAVLRAAENPASLPVTSLRTPVNVATKSITLSGFPSSSHLHPPSPSLTSLTSPYAVTSPYSSPQTKPPIPSSSTSLSPSSTHRTNRRLRQAPVQPRTRMDAVRASFHRFLARLSTWPPFVALVTFVLAFITRILHNLHAASSEALYPWMKRHNAREIEHLPMPPPPPPPSPPATITQSSSATSYTSAVNSSRDNGKKQTISPVYRRFNSGGINTSLGGRGSRGDEIQLAVAASCARAASLPYGSGHWNGSSAGFPSGVSEMPSPQRSDTGTRSTPKKSMRERIRDSMFVGRGKTDGESSMRTPRTPRSPRTPSRPGLRKAILMGVMRKVVPGLGRSGHGNGGESTRKRRVPWRRNGGAGAA